MADGSDIIDLAKERKKPRKKKPDAKPAEEYALEDLPEGVHPCTDLANAHRLRIEFGANNKHVPEIGWLHYDEKRWGTEGADAAVRRDAHETTVSIFRNGLTEWAKTSQQSKRISAMVSEAAHLEGIASTASSFDADPMLLNCSNGTVNLCTGQRRPHIREDFITRLAPVEFLPDAVAPEWLNFLDVIFAGNAELITFVQRALGYSLSGSTREQCFFVGHGSGKNGKSTLVETVRYVIGDYAMGTTSDTLMRLRDGQGRGTNNDLARLRGARFVSAIETDEGKRLDEARIKTMTGTDAVTARFLFKEFFDFAPQFSVWLMLNHKPEIVGVDDAIWRRVKLIPFDVTIPESARKKNMLDLLKAEAPGILAWLIRGSVDYWNHGLAEPASVAARVTEWRADANIVEAFIAERCTVHERHSVSAAKLSEAFGAWAKQMGAEPLSAKAMKPRLVQLGYTQAPRSKKGMRWEGLALDAADVGDELSRGVE